MKELRVALRLEAKDQGSKDVRRVITSIDKAARDSSQAQQRGAASAQRVIRREVSQTAQAERGAAQRRIRDSERTNQVITNDSRRVNQARERLGIQSERRIQNEITRTAIAYKRLEQSGRLSGRELARAADAAQQKIRRLQSELQGAERDSRNWGRGLAAIGGGLMAGAAVAKRPLSQVMDYDRQIALISNTAYSDSDVAGRQAGQQEVQAAIRSAIRQGGGTREGAADGLYALLGDGGLDREQAYELLPTLQKMALGAGKNSADLVPLVSALRAQGVEDLPNALGKVLHSSETGGFGLDSMIALLPQVLQAQKDLGMSGMVGLDATLANMQGITQETGLPDRAAQSTVALLNALRDPMVAKQVSEKLSIGGERVDLASTLTQGIAQGVDPLETLAAMLDKSMSSNKGYAKLRANLLNSSSADDVEQFSAMLESTVLKDLGIQKSAILALSSYMAQRENIAGLRADYKGRGLSSIDASAEVMLSTASEKANIAGQDIADARQRGLQSTADALGDVSAKISEYAAKYPDLTAAIVSATDAIKVMTAAAVAFGGIRMITGMGRNGPVRGGGRTGRGGGSRGREIDRPRQSHQINTPKNNFTKLSAKSVPLLNATMAVADGAQILSSDASFEEKGAETTRLVMGTAGSVGGAWGGATVGAAAGSVIPGLGTAVGGAVGAILGSIGGGAAMDEIGAAVGKWIFGSEAKQTEPDGWYDRPGFEVDGDKNGGELLLQKMSALLEKFSDLKISVDVQNGNIVASVNEANALEARRH